MLSSRSSSGLRLAVDLSLEILVKGSGKKLLLNRGGGSGIPKFVV